MEKNKKDSTTRGCFEDFKKKLRCWESEYNNFPMKPLGWKSPNEKLAEALPM